MLGSLGDLTLLIRPWSGSFKISESSFASVAESLCSAASGDSLRLLLRLHNTTVLQVNYLVSIEVYRQVVGGHQHASSLVLDDTLEKF